jgi:hypothetical protein
MKRALVIPSNAQPYTVMVEHTYDFIQATVGGWFDCVRGDSFHAYVHDTGLIDGQPFNAVASVIFGQVICGEVVVFGSLNAQGQYDGEEHAVDTMVAEVAKRQWFLLRVNADAQVPA